MKKDSLNKQIVEWICENFEDAVFLADGYEEAFVGVVHRDDELCSVYDIEKCIQALIDEGMSPVDALEYFEYNTLGSNFGKGTPIFYKRFDPKFIDNPKKNGKIYAEQFEFSF